MATTMINGSAAYKIVRATLVITTPLPSLENSSKRDAAQPKKAFKTGTFVLSEDRLGTSGICVSTRNRPLVGATSAGIAAGNGHGVRNHATGTGVAAGNGHGLRDNQTVIGRVMCCRLNSYGACDKAGKYD